MGIKSLETLRYIEFQLHLLGCHPYIYWVVFKILIPSHKHILPLHLVIMSCN